MHDVELTHLVSRLEGVAMKLEGITRTPEEDSREAVYRKTLFEAVEVLEETKHSFRSRRLKELRERIETVLQEF